MKRRTLLTLLGGGSLVGSLTLGSGAFTGETAHRNTTVAVVGDDDAYLTLEFPQTSVSFGCSTSVSVTVRNRTGASLDTVNLRFTPTVGSIASLGASGPGSYDTSGDTVSLDSGVLGPGQEVTVTAAVDGFTGQGTTQLAFGVDASGDSIAVATTSNRVVPLQYDCPVPAFGKDLTCPVSVSQSLPQAPSGPSVSAPSVSVPQSDCATLAFDQAVLRSVEDSLDFSQGPGGLRSALNAKNGIDITKRVLSDALTPDQITQMPATPSTLVLGGNNPQARIGTTGSDAVANVPGAVTLENNSTVVGVLDVDGKFTLDGGSAVAGDVTAATTGTVANSLLLGGLTVTTAGNAVSVTNDMLVCGAVDTAGEISEIKNARVGGPVTAGGDISELSGSTIEATVSTKAGSGGDISVTSSSLVAGDVVADGAIPNLKGSAVAGTVEADGDVSGIKQSDVGGDVVTTDGSDGDVTIEESTVGGAITADGNVSDVKSNSTVVGDVTTRAGGNGSVTVQNSVVAGSIDADGNVPGVNSNSTVGGDLTAGGDVSELKNSTVVGSVTADGNVPAIENATVGGDVTTADGSDGAVTVKNSDVAGSIHADGAVPAIKSGSRVAGSVDADGSVSSIKNSEVGGDVTTTDGGDATVENSTIGGQMDIVGTISSIKGSEVGGPIDAGTVGQLKGARIGGSVTATDAAATGTAIAIEKKDTKSVVCGNVETNGRVEKIKHSQVNGSVHAAQVGKLKGKTTEIGGNVKTTDETAALKIKNNTTVYGSVDAAGPVPEVNSSRVEGNLTAGGELKVKNSEVCTATNAGLETTDRGKVTVKSGSTVGGNIDAAGPVEKIKNSTVEGSVASDSDAKVEGASSTVEGSVTTKNRGAITIKSATIEGAIAADGPVVKIKSASVGGGVTAGGPVEKIKSADVAGAVTAGGDVKIKGSTTGPVTTTTGSGGDLILESSSTVEGAVILDGEVTTIKGSTVEGDVRTGGGVRKITNSRIEGTIDAGGDVALEGSTTVTGDVVATGKVTRSGNVTVGGKVKENQ